MNNNTAVKPLSWGVTLAPGWCLPSSGALPPPPRRWQGFSPGSGTHVFPSRALAVTAMLQPACCPSASAVNSARRNQPLLEETCPRQPRTSPDHPRPCAPGPARGSPPSLLGGHCHCLCWGGQVSAAPAGGVPSGLCHLPPPQLDALTATTPTLLQPSFGLEYIY